MNLVYLHGFASGPQSLKGRHLQRVVVEAGGELHLPDLNVPSFERLSLGAMLETMDALDRERASTEPWGLIGSSLGGWVAARWAQLRPARVRKLVLLCPAFDLPSRWAAWLSTDTIAQWEGQGWIPLPDADGHMRPLHFGFLEESRNEPERPIPACPLTIVHGIRDERVPISISRELKAEHPQIHLVEVDDDHALTASLEQIAAVVRSELL